MTQIGISGALTVQSKADNLVVVLKQFVNGFMNDSHVWVYRNTAVIKQFVNVRPQQNPILHQTDGSSRYAKPAMAAWLHSLVEW